MRITVNPKLKLFKTVLIGVMYYWESVPKKQSFVERSYSSEIYISPTVSEERIAIMYIAYAGLNDITGRTKERSSSKPFP